MGDSEDQGGREVTKKITVNPLDPDSIRNAIQDLQEEKERIHRCADSLVRLLTNLGLEKARDLIPIDTGVAQASIIGYFDEVY